MPGFGVTAAFERLGGRIAPWHHRITYVAELVRWRDWRASKLTFFLAGMSYAGLVHAAPGLPLLGRMAALTAILCLFAAFGHLVNDYSDLEVDRVAGKKRLLAEWPLPALHGVLFGLATASLAIAAACLDRRHSSSWPSRFCSAPPIRCRRRGSRRGRRSAGSAPRWPSARCRWR